MIENIICNNHYSTQWQKKIQFIDNQIINVTFRIDGLIKKLLVPH